MPDSRRSGTLLFRWIRVYLAISRPPASPGASNFGQGLLQVQYPLPILGDASAAKLVPTRSSGSGLAVYVRIGLACERPQDPVTGVTVFQKPFDMVYPFRELSMAKCNSRLGAKLIPERVSDSERSTTQQEDGVVTNTMVGFTDHIMNPLQLSILSSSYISASLMPPDSWLIPTHQQYGRALPPPSLADHVYASSGVLGSSLECRRAAGGDGL